MAKHSSKKQPFNPFTGRDPAIVWAEIQAHAIPVDKGKILKDLAARIKAKKSAK